MAVFVHEGDVRILHKAVMPGQILLPKKSFLHLTTQ